MNLSDQSDSRPRPLLMVVEDDRDTQTYMRRMLSRDFELLFAVGGAELRAHLGSRGAEIRLVLMDISLQGDEDGVTLTRYLRQQPQFATVPIIVTTAHVATEVRIAAHEAGCDEFMNKPIARQLLLDRIAFHLARSQSPHPAVRAVVR